MPLRALLALIATVVSAPIVTLRAQSVPQDASAHGIQQISVAPGVQLEVLDWGGTGPALVFLAGYGNSAHIFDDFAPQFADKYHVIGISRREFGGSSRHVAEHDSATLAKDIVTILDSLRLPRASFVAHSFGGSELNYLGAYDQDRVVRLVYLDAGFDFARLYKDPVWQAIFPVPEPPEPVYSSNSLAQWRLWAERLSGPAYPMAELRQMFQVDEQDDVIGSRQAPELVKQFQDGALPVDFSRIKVPVLALYADAETASVAYPYWNSMDVTGRARLQKAFAMDRRVKADHIAQFTREVVPSRVVLIPGGRHYLFLTHPGEVAHEIRQFLAGS